MISVSALRCLRRLKSHCLALLLPPPNLFLALKYGLLIVSSFRNAFKDIHFGRMCILLLRHAQKRIQRPPALQCFLHSANIEQPMMKVVNDFLIRFLSEESLVGMYGVSSEKSSLWLRHEFLDVFEEVGGCLLGSCFRCEDCGCETALAVGSSTPFILCCLVVAGKEELRALPFCPWSPWIGVSLLPSPPRLSHPSSHL